MWTTVGLNFCALSHRLHQICWICYTVVIFKIPPAPKPNWIKVSFLSKFFRTNFSALQARVYMTECPHANPSLRSILHCSENSKAIPVLKCTFNLVPSKEKATASLDRLIFISASLLVFKAFFCLEYQEFPLITYALLSYINIHTLH